MNQQERNLIVKQLQQAFTVYGKPLDVDAIDMWLAVLGDYSANQISYGIKQHLRDPKEGRFPPKPANIVGAIEGAQRNLWISGDEAWAEAQPAIDENNTLVWTNEAKLAWFSAAYPLMSAGDKVAARRAFLDAYEREIDNAIAEGLPPKHEVSKGHDHDGRRPAIEAARERGLLTDERAEQALLGDEREVVGDGQAVAGLLGHGDPTKASDEAIDWVMRIKQELSAMPNPTEERRLEREAERKALDERREKALNELRAERPDDGEAEEGAE